LDEYVFAAFHGLHSERHVGAGRRENEHGVEIGVGQHLAVILVLLAGAKQPGTGCGALRPQITDRRQIDVLHRHEARQIISRGHHATTGHPHPDLFHGTLRGAIYPRRESDP
jgi:hypothetical protein